MQVRVAYACEMMPGQQRIHCCCPGENGHASAHKTKAGDSCCDKQVVSSDGIADEHATLDQFSKVVPDPLAPPQLIAYEPAPQLAFAAFAADHYLAPPLLTGTDTYLATARLRL